MMTVLVRFALAAAAVASIAVACGPATTPVPSDRRDVWETAVDMPDGARLPVSLLDRTGLVDGIAAGEPDLAGDGISGADGNRTLVWDWVGGSCDTAVFLTFERTGAGFRLLTRTETTGDICDLAGIGHRIQIVLTEPVDPASVVVAPGQ